MRPSVQPVSVSGPENPYPGSDGITRWNAWAGSPPDAAGSVSGPIRSRNSTTEPGQPCSSMSGVASGWAERTCRKCTWAPSMVVTNWG